MTTTNLENKINQLESAMSALVENNDTENAKINSTIATTNENLASLKANLSSMGNTISSNTAMLGNLTNEINNANSSIGLIGGINLVNNNTTNFGEKGWVSNSYGFGTGNATLVGGKTYTLTVCAEISEAAQTNGQHFVIEMYTSDWSSCARIDIEGTTPTVSQTTIIVPETENYIINSYSYPQKNNSENVTLYWYNVQEGEVGTSWVPSIYDLQNILLAKQEL